MRPTARPGLAQRRSASGPRVFIPRSADRPGWVERLMGAGVYPVDVNRRAKIVCTLGPAVDTPELIRDLVDAGMDVARLNFSHGSHEEHESRYAMVRAAAAASDRAVGILADLQGPKIRLGRFQSGPVEWSNGENVVITSEHVEGTHDRVSCTYDKLPQEVKVGDRLLIDDGKVAVEVEQVRGADICCLVVEGGPVSNNKGVSLPNVAVSVPAMSEKDADDLRFALRLEVDMVALSFVRSAEDVKLVHGIMDDVGRRVPIIAKIEKPEAVARLDAIVHAFDGLMVARGDLGVELPLEQVPLVQKRAVQLCREHAKPVIVATQMLDSMIDNARPTRAEASDVANAVIDGTDAVMLSGETSVGKYPVETVRTMAKIVEAAEEDLLAKGLPPLTERNKPRTQGGAVARAAAEMGDFLGARFLVAFTQSGDTARRL